MAILEEGIPPRQTTPGSTIGSSKQRTAKTLDPPLFYQLDSDITLENWTQYIRDKLIVNKDHFEDDTTRIIYIISRTRGITAKQIYSYRTEDPNYFATPDEVLSILQDVIDNPNKRSDIRREFKALKIKATETFAAFLPKFQFNTIKGLRDYCQRVDNQLRNIDSTHERKKELVKRAIAPPTSSLKVPRVAAYTPPMKRPSVEPAVIIAPRRTVSPKPPSGNYHNYGKEGH
ncbi:hypothetical protein ABVK25_003524 [Lepraria finkii]|uniref:Uncharacterized protein n=1 Tax=Lepraria finkii TaxID=1340010 RepID=A0ABR4BDF9_9LECA